MMCQWVTPLPLAGNVNGVAQTAVYQPDTPRYLTRLCGADYREKTDYVVCAANQA